MHASQPADALLRFGAFEADVQTGELRKQGKRIRLQDQPFQLLVMLLEAPGQVVTRDELRNKLWPQTTVDFDHGLNKAISKIREALGDSSEHPRFVETVARRGYRFLADVTPIDTGADRQPGPAADGLVAPTDSHRVELAAAGVPPKPLHQGYAWKRLGFGLTLVLAASLAWILYSQTLSSPKI